MAQKMFVLGFLMVLAITTIPFGFAQEAEVVKIVPTDDTFVVIDFSDPTDIRGLQKLAPGDLDFLKTWYAWNISDVDIRLVSTTFLKFDLNDISSHEIKSAKLQLYANVTKTITNSTGINIFSLNGTSWSEKDLSYSDGVTLFERISEPQIIDKPDFYSWDITQYVIDNADSEIAIAAGFDTVLDKTEELVSFTSKDFSDSNYHPILLIETMPKTQNLTPSKSTILTLTPTDDAYVINNYNDPQDLFPLTNINTGNFNFTKIWYSNNATGNGEVITTTGFMKFDLSELDPEKIIDAKLQMFNTRVDTSDAERIISISTTSNSTWNESELNFTNKPEFIKEIAFAEINTVNDWISWNVTDVIKENAGSEITLSASYSKFFPGSEEQTIFNSKESGENTPYLEIVYDESNGGGCLIATATYGSELAPQVQQLRELRDNQLLQTETGSAFMESFNQFYYSFSPYIADLERENPIFKEIVKLAITPMLTSLSILNYVDIDSEQEMLGYGISIILLNLGMYVAAPAMLLYKARKLYNL